MDIQTHQMTQAMGLKDCTDPSLYTAFVAYRMLEVYASS
jgi:hypothetical protein